MGDRPGMSGDAERWHPGSWRSRPIDQAVDYPDAAALARATDFLAASPPLVSPAEAARLRAEMVRVARGEALLLQGGDCAERFDASPQEVTLPTLNLLSELADMLAAATGLGTVRVARMAGQFAKPRSSPIERHGAIALPAWRGDIVNGEGFDAGSRAPDPSRMLRGYRDAAGTLDLMRLASPDSFASHEALLLDYEQALTRTDGGRHWCLSAHMVWIGERTRRLDGAHVEYARRIANVVGLKCGPELEPDALLRLVDRLDPLNEPGRLVLIARLGAEVVEARLPALMRATRAAGREALWVCDPMHGNTRKHSGGKSRAFADILREVRAFLGICAAECVFPGGIHLELTGADVLEVDPGKAIGPISGAYRSGSDPRLNADQARRIVGAFAEGLGEHRRQRRAA